MSGKLYGIKHSGPCLLVGYGPDVRSEVERARLLRPAAPMLGVKFAGMLYPEIEHVWTQHLEQAEGIRERTAGRTIYIHARPKSVQRAGAIHLFGKTQVHIDYVWPELSWVAGGSGIAASMWARHGMGFDEVILCGIPVTYGGYSPEIGSFKKLAADQGRSFANEEALQHWRGTLHLFKDKGRTQGVYSMGGWTREVLGAPQ